MDNIDLGTIDVYSDTAPEYDDGGSFLGELFDTYAMESERESDSDALYESMFASGEPVNTNNRQYNNSINSTMQMQAKVVETEMTQKQQLKDFRDMTSDFIMGYTPDMGEDDVKVLQKKIGASADGQWGAGSKAALKLYTKNKDSYSKISDSIGLPLPTVATLVNIESAGKGYDARNPNSSAFGKYQFMTYDTKSTGYPYAKALGYEGNPGEELREWMTPERQDAMFVNLTKDNMAALKRSKIEPNAFSIYGAHQQGVSGFKQILAGTPSKTVEKNMRANLPSKYSELKGKELSDAWIDFWKKKTNTD